MSRSHLEAIQLLEQDLGSSRRDVVSAQQLVREHTQALSVATKMLELRQERVLNIESSINKLRSN